MGRTSTEVKQRWIDKTYKRIMVNLREDSATDKRLLEFLEDYKDELGGTTQIFREALDQYITDNFPYYGKE